jgi:hypothetical protein
LPPQAALPLQAESGGRFCAGHVPDLTLPLQVARPGCQWLFQSSRLRLSHHDARPYTCPAGVAAGRFWGRVRLGVSPGPSRTGTGSPGPGPGPGHQSEGPCAVTGRLLGGCESEARHSHCRALVGPCALEPAGHRGNAGCKTVAGERVGARGTGSTATDPNGKWKS